jgi:rRNA maturation endonuclease Nob1
MFDMFVRHKKRCSMCGCYMYHDMPEDICEVCLDELLNSEPEYDEELDEW